VRFDRKVALEEHVVLPPLTAPGSVGAPIFHAAYISDIQHRLGDSDKRLEDMNRFGIELMVLSLTQPGVQGICHRDQAVDTARRLNDQLAEFVGRRAERFAAFAALPLQDPAAAGDELERAVRQLGFKGALINGFSNIDDERTAQYLDEPPVWEFWERASALGVPVYLHPREPLVTQRRIYEGYPALVASAWGFGIETATHCLRLMMSGLFDRFSNLRIIVGHLGEGLPFLLPRVEHRLRHAHVDVGGKQTRPLMDYFRENFYITTSGTWRTSALLDTILEVGAERILFSMDYPFENMQEQSEWFEMLPLSETDKHKIARENAHGLLKLP
jgi:2,3-dihydroxybenzoate decarboxylase